MGKWELRVEGGPENGPILTLERDGEVYHVYCRGKNFILVSQESGQPVPVWFAEAVKATADWLKRHPNGLPVDDFMPMIEIE